MRRFRISAGQSLVFMAVVLLVLIAFAGLSIDTGKAFSRQRTIQAGANAGAVAGMTSVIKEQTNTFVLSTIENSIKENVKTANTPNPKIVQVTENFPVGDAAEIDTIYFRAYYMTTDGTKIPVAATGFPPVGAHHLVVDTMTPSRNMFASVVGVPSYTVTASGAAGRGACLRGIYPITFHQKYLEDEPSGLWKKPVPMPDPYADPSRVPASSTFTVYRKDFSSSGSGEFLWTTWNGSGASSVTSESMSGAGNIGDGFIEANPLDPKINDPDAMKSYKNNQLDIGDWLPGNTGNEASLDDILKWHKDNRTLMILPVHDKTNGANGMNAAYHVSSSVLVRLLDYDVKSKKFFKFGLVENDPVCAIPEQPPIPGPELKVSLEVPFQEQRLWYKDDNVSDYDIVVLLDYSDSMKYCWDTVKTCKDGSRRIDIAVPVVKSFVDEMITKRTALYGFDNRVSLVTFGMTKTTGGSKRSIAETKIPFMNGPDAVKAFNTLYSSPVKNTDLGEGGTPTASGLKQAFSEIAKGARKFNSKGKPVKLSILMITDGMANVLYDSPHQGLINMDYPFKCGDAKSGNTDNPVVQYECPSAAVGGSVRSPIKAAIGVMSEEKGNLLATGRDFTSYAVLINGYGSFTEKDYHLHEMADEAYSVKSASLLDDIVAGISLDLGEPCINKSDPLSGAAAAGAKVVVTEQLTGAPVAGSPFTLNSDGVLIVPEVKPGLKYNLVAEHLGVASPNDPKSVKYDYTKMNVGSDPALLDRVSVAVPATAQNVFRVTDPIFLKMADETIARCK